MSSHALLYLHATGVDIMLKHKSAYRVAIRAIALLLGSASFFSQILLIWATMSPGVMFSAMYTRTCRSLWQMGNPPRRYKPLLIPHHIPSTILPTTLQFMNRRIIKLMRSIIRVQFPYLAAATSRLKIATMLRSGRTRLFHRRAIWRCSLLHEPAPLPAEPDDTAKCQE